MSGTSFATPIATGVAALLLSLQIQRGETPNPQKVRDVILKSALPCTPADASDASRCLVGKLNIPGSLKYLFGGTVSDTTEAVAPSGCGCTGIEPTEVEASDLSPVNGSNRLIDNVSFSQTVTAEQPAATFASAPVNQSQSAASPTASSIAASIPQSIAPSIPPMTSSGSNFVTASQAPSELADSQLVYALGTLGYDFGTEARRDSFK